MVKEKDLEKDLESNQKEISVLQTFRQTKYVKQHIRQLFGEQSFIKSKINKLQYTQESKEKTRQDRLATANQNRSEKMKRTWRYLRAIKENHTIELSLRELRSALKKHRQGLETDVSDIAWRNPSP